MSVQYKYLGPWMMLKPAPDVCQECAVKHEPEQPHNQQSLHYQYHFYGLNGRWPTWKDAMEHCDAEIKGYWKKALAEEGIKI